MNGDVRDVVIVGGGLTGAKAAEAAREHGYDGRITVLAEEVERPYERPPLSKGYLVGDTPAEDVYVHPNGFYDAHAIDLRLGDPVTGIDRGARRVLTRGGEQLRFDRLLIATGARPRRVPLRGGEHLEGIVVLRTLEDSRHLAERLHAVEHVTIVGAGWIGCEVAAAARTLGRQVTMVDPLEVPLVRVLGADVGRVFADLHREHGVDLRMGAAVEAVRGDGAVEQVTTSDGATIDTQLVVVGVGVIPQTDLAERAGLDVDDGILVDDRLRTSDPTILAAGDVARAWHPLFDTRIRVEHWANARNQGTTAGHNLAGAEERYDRVPYFYSDQYDVGMEYTGYAPAWDQLVLRGSPEARQFVAFWLHRGRVVAGMHANAWGVVEHLQALVRSSRPVDPARLADPDVGLQQLAAA